ncbi:MAG: TetR/AcrR family transcriptional regulator [Natronomonas sp.]
MKGFSEEKRTQLEEALIREASEQFTRDGLEGTRIADLTDAVGIGTSTFYTFFESKEALYLRVLRREAERISAEIEREIDDATSLEREVAEILRYVFEELESNRLYYQSIVDDERRVAGEELSDEAIRRNYDEILSLSTGLAERWTEHERFSVDDPELMVNLVRTIAPFVTQRERLQREAGEEAYEAVKSLLIETLVDGLIDQPRTE